MTKIIGQPQTNLNIVDLVKQASVMGKSVMNNPINTPIRQSTLHQATISAQMVMRLARTTNLQQSSLMNSGVKKMITFGSVASI